MEFIYEKCICADNECAPRPSVDAIIYRIPSTRGTVSGGRKDDERASRERERERGSWYDLYLAYGSQGRAIDSVRS